MKSEKFLGVLHRASHFPVDEDNMSKEQLQKTLIGTVLSNKFMKILYKQLIKADSKMNRSMLLEHNDDGAKITQEQTKNLLLRMLKLNKFIHPLWEAYQHLMNKDESQIDLITKEEEEVETKTSSTRERLVWLQEVINETRVIISAWLTAFLLFADDEAKPLPLFVPNKSESQMISVLCVTSMSWIILKDPVLYVRIYVQLFLLNLL